MFSIVPSPIPASFTGDKKVGQSILGRLEKKPIAWLTPRVPSWLSSQALTYSTIPICVFIILFSWLAQYNLNWLWGVSFMIFLQWLTDSLDGAVGRYRNSGLLKWGYYMDHFLDYIFLCSILIGYSLLLPDNLKYLQFFLLALFGAFMVNSYLALAATNEFKISYLGIGPTEVRLVFIMVNTLLIILGKTHLAFTLPYIMGLTFVGLAAVVYHTQKSIFALDMETKNKAS